MNLDTFIGLCEAVLKERGRDVDAVTVHGWIGLPGRCYSDKRVTIASAKYQDNNLFEVTVHYLSNEGESVNNPAIMVEDGKTFRRHGDWMRVAEHVKHLARL